MANQELTDYVRLALGQGKSREEIKKELLLSGWREGQVEEAFASIKTSDSGSQLTRQPLQFAVPLQEKPLAIAANKMKKTLALLLIVFAGISLLAGAGVLAYRAIALDPKRLLLASFENFGKAQSYSMRFELDRDLASDIKEFRVDVEANQDRNQYSKIKLEFIYKNPDESEDSFSFTAIANQKEIFIRPAYTRLGQIENQLASLYPDITALRSYQLVQPVLHGEHWLRLDLATFEQTSEEGRKPSVSEEELEELQQDFYAALVFRSFAANYEVDGKGYRRIVLGFNKEKLVAFLEGLKRLDLDISLSDLKALIDFVASIDGWNQDLVEALIERETGNFYRVSLALPELPEPKGEADGARVSGEKVQTKDMVLKGALAAVERFVEKGKPGTVVQLGAVTFADYNQVAIMQAPKEIVEFAEIEVAIEEELLPLIDSIMQAGQVPEESFLLNQ